MVLWDFSETDLLQKKNYWQVLSTENRSLQIPLEVDKSDCEDALFLFIYNL